MNLSSRDKKWLALSTKIAALSECNQRHGALIVKGGSVLSMGVNKTTNTPRNLSKYHINGFASVHSEVQAIRQASPGALRGATIYVSRINNRGQTLLSRPCADCYGVIVAAGIKKIIYTG